MNGSRQTRIVVWVVLGVVAFLLLLLAAGGAWGGGDSWHWGMMGFGGLWMILPIGLMVLMMYAMMSMMGHGGHGDHEQHSRGDDARAVLDRRYAAGEVTREEYERIRNDLERKP